MGELHFFGDWSNGEVADVADGSDSDEVECPVIIACLIRSGVVIAVHGHHWSEFWVSAWVLSNEQWFDR